MQHIDVEHHLDHGELLLSRHIFAHIHVTQQVGIAGHGPDDASKDECVVVISNKRVMRQLDAACLEIELWTFCKDRIQDVLDSEPEE